jgi:hypothetical protein
LPLVFDREAINDRNQAGVVLFEELLTLAEKDGVSIGDEDNLVKIFMHQIMVFLSGHFIQMNGELDGVRYSKRGSFPYVDRNFFLAPTGFETLKVTKARKQKIPIWLLNFITSLLFFITNWRFSGRRLELCVSSNLSVSAVKLAMRAIKAGVMPHWFKSQPIAIKNLDRQLENLNDFMEKWFDRYSIGNGALRAKLFRDEILRFVYADNKNMHEQTPRNKQFNMLLTGSQAKIDERLNAVNAIKRGNYVFLLSHGLHSSHAIDEPIIGYAERSYCHAEICYGRNLPIVQSYNLPLTSPCDFLARSPNAVMTERNNAGSSNTHLAASIGKNPKILYVPTALTGNNNYLPFRNIPDRLYLAWQRSLAQAIPRMTIKPHPKQTVEAVSNFSAIETGKLSDVIQHYDLLIFDYISSAFAEAVASDKAIMYLETGGRNLSKQALAAIKDRCHYVDARDGSTQITDEVKPSNFEGKNRFAYTDLFSMAAADLATAEPTSEEAGVIREMVNYVAQRRNGEF